MALHRQIAAGLEWSISQAATGTGQPWARVSGVTDAENPTAFEDGRFAFSFASQAIQPEPEIDAACNLRLEVDLYREALGHPMDEEPAFLDEMRFAADALEAGSYPPGVEGVWVEQQQLRRMGDFLVGILLVRVRYIAASAPGGEAAAEWTPGG